MKPMQDSAFERSHEDAMDQLHQALAEHQAGEPDPLADEPDAKPEAYPELQMPSADSVAASLRRGRAMKAKPVPSVDVTAGEPTILSRNGQPETPAAPEAQPEPAIAASPSTPRGAMLSAVMGAAKGPAAAPPVDTSKPLGAGPDSDMDGLRENAASARRMGEIGKSVTAYQERPTNQLDAIQQLGGVHPSARPHNGMWDNAGAPEDQAVKDLGAKRQGDAAKASATDRKDPNSETAKTYRAVLKKFAPDLNLDGATSEQMEKIAPWLEKYAAENGEQLKAKSLADARAAEEAKKEATHATEHAETLANQKSNHADAQAIAASNNNIAKASLGLRQEEAGERKQNNAEKKVEDVPPGFEIAGDAHPSGETRKKFTALVSSAEKMKGLTAQMREALKGTSGVSRTMDPKTVTKLKQLGTMISIEGKNVAGLGALSGPDMGLMEAIASDPTSIKANLTVDLPRMLDQLDAWGDNSVDGESRASGVHRTGKPAAQHGDGMEHKTLSSGAKAHRKPGGQWEVDD